MKLKLLVWYYIVMFMVITAIALIRVVIDWFQNIGTG